MQAAVIATKPRFLDLGAIMFFQLFAFSFISQNASLYLTKVLGFSGIETGIILAFTAISFFIGPLLGTYVTDRIIHAKHLYLIIMSVMTASSIGLFFVRDFWPVLILVFLNFVSMSPSMAIVNAVVLQEMRVRTGSSNRFGRVRLWGTLGWMVCGFLAFCLWNFGQTVLPSAPELWIKASGFFLTALGAVMGALVFSKLPKGELKKEPVRSFIPKDAFSVIRQPSILLLGLVSVLSSILERFYFFGSSLYLKFVGFEVSHIPLINIIGQVFEIPMLFIFSFLLRKLGFYKVLLVGVSVQIGRYLLFFTGSPALGLVALSLNGIIFACLGNAITMFIDKHADEKNRTSVHQLLGLFYGGTAWFIGNLLSGIIFNNLDKSNLDFSGFWIIPLIGSILIGLLMVFVLRKPITSSPFNKELG